MKKKFTFFVVKPYSISEYDSYKENGTLIQTVLKWLCYWLQQIQNIVRNLVLYLIKIFNSESPQ